MRTLTTVFFAVVLVLVLGFVGVVSAQGTETLSQRIERLKAEEAKRLANETPTDRIIRLRAEQIRIDRELKKAREEAGRKGDSATREAMKEVDKVTKAEKREADALRRAVVSGCDPNSIWIHPNSVPRWTINSSVKVRIFNPEQVAVDIEDPQYGVVVRGLCPGGSMTLFRARGLSDAEYQHFRLTARATLPDGSMVIDQSQTFTLSSHDWSSGRGQQLEDWTVQLRKLRQITR